MGVPKVKPLVWVDGRISRSSERETAESILGVYEVLRWYSGHYGGTLPDADLGKEFGGRDSLDAAKAVAQADFERRILSALDLSESE